jgi:hypothetical protein
MQGAWMGSILGTGARLCTILDMTFAEFQFHALRCIRARRGAGAARDPDPSLTVTQERPEAEFSDGHVMSGRFPASQGTGHTVAAVAHKPPPPPVGWQNCPAGQSQEVLQGVAEPIVAQYPPPSEAPIQRQPPTPPPWQDSGLLGAQEIADGGIQEAAQVRWPEVPLQTSGLQQSLPLLQEPPSGMHIGVVEVVLVEVEVVGVVVEVLVEVEVYETERHLLYVACTRARDHLLVTSGDLPSEFLDDLRL